MAWSSPSMTRQAMGSVNLWVLEVGGYTKVYRSDLVETDTIDHAHGAVRTLGSGRRVECVIEGERAREVREVRYRG